MIRPYDNEFRAYSSYASLVGLEGADGSREDEVMVRRTLPAYGGAPIGGVRCSDHPVDWLPRVSMRECLQGEIGRGAQYADVLFAMIQRDLDAIMDCAVRYEPPHVPIPWPATVEGLRMRF
jgi:hypothetical protein